MRIYFRGEELQQLSQSSGHRKGQAGRRNLGQVRQQDLSSSVWAGGGKQGWVHAFASALGPMHLNIALPRLLGGFLLPAPARQSQGAWLLASTLPFLQANNKVPIMQTRRLTHGVLTCPSGYKMRAHRFNMGGFNAIKAHLMLQCEVFNTCKSLFQGPVSWCYPHSSQKGMGIVCQKTGLSHGIHRRVRLYYSHNWCDCNTVQT